MSRLLQKMRAWEEKPVGFLGRDQLLGASLLPLSSYSKAFTPPLSLFPAGIAVLGGSPHP